MRKYRTKPVVVEAVQFLAGWPPPEGVTFPDYSVDPPVPAYYTAPDGTKIDLTDGDWLVFPSPGVVRVWSNREFTATYDRVPEA